VEKFFHACPGCHIYSGQIYENENDGPFSQSAFQDRVPGFFLKMQEEGIEAAGKFWSSNAEKTNSFRMSGFFISILLILLFTIVRRAVWNS